MIRSTLIALASLSLVSLPSIAGEVGNSFSNSNRIEYGGGSRQSSMYYQESGEKFEVSLQRDAGMSPMGQRGAGAYTRSDTQSTFDLYQKASAYESYKFVGSDSSNTRSTFAN